MKPKAILIAVLLLPALWGWQVLIVAGAAPAELRKLPPEDTKPGAQWARRTVHEWFPELLERHFDGSVVLALVFRLNGSLLLGKEHRFPPGVTPSDFDMAAEATQLGLEPQDVLYKGTDHGGATIGPWLHSKNLGRLHIVYEVLKWPPDPTRSVAKVRAAVEAYFPKLLEAPQNPHSAGVLVTVLMNDDGTVNRVRKRTLGNPTSNLGDSPEQFVAALGASKKALGRRGFLVLPRAPQTANVFVAYAWPRRPGDPTADLDKLRRSILRQHPPRRDTRDDAAIVHRYFSDIEKNGARALFTISHHGRRVTPWVLFGRDGRVWDTGRGYYLGDFPLKQELEARFPGIRVSLAGHANGIRTHRGVRIDCLWIGPDSPVQKEANVDFGRRSDLLVTVYRHYLRLPGVLNRPGPTRQFVFPVNFGVPTGIGMAAIMHAHGLHGRVHDDVQLIATDAGPGAVTIEVRTRDALASSAVPAGSHSWAPAATLRIPYGDEKAVDLPDATARPAGRVQLVLQPRRLRRSATGR